MVEQPIKTRGLTFGPCSRCSKNVYGHAVYYDGQLLCAWCDLDLLLNVNALSKIDKIGEKEE